MRLFEVAMHHARAALPNIAACGFGAWTPSKLENFLARRRRRCRLWSDGAGGGHHHVGAR